MKKRMRWTALGCAMALMLTGVGVAVSPAVQAQTGTILILDTTVTGGLTSSEATYAASLGYTIELVTAAQWATKTAADFGSYRAIILGDPDCITDDTPLAAPTANAGVWGPQVDGEIIIIGTDNVFHTGTGQADQLVQRGIDFAVSDPASTGLYMTLSCYYDGVAANTPVPALAGIDGGGFTVEGTDCDDTVHITASHPALNGLTDDGLTDWGCSTHEAFNTFPATFAPLAMAVQVDGAYISPDGTRGEVYIIARGVEVFRALTLTPETATNFIGSDHTVLATYVLNGNPQVNATITFTVTTGPHAGTTGTANTDPAGQAAFTYAGTTVGTDEIVASTLIGTTPILSNVAMKTWEEAPVPEAPPAVAIAGRPSFTG